MSTEAIATVVRMLGTLPDATQNQVVGHLQDYIADLQNEMRWNEAYTTIQTSLVENARLAKQQIAAGKAQALNIDDL